MFGRFVKSCSGNFNSEEKADEVAKFFEEKQTKIAERSIQQCVETVRSLAAWRARSLEGLSYVCYKRLRRWASEMKSRGLLLEIDEVRSRNWMQRCICARNQKSLRTHLSL